MSENKNKIQVEWPPKGTFTIAQLQTLNPKVINITLRFKLKKAIEDGLVVAIGKNASKMGRPTLVLTQSKPSKQLLASAKASGVMLDQAYEKQLDSTVVAEFRKAKSAPKCKSAPKKKVEEQTYVDAPATETVTVS